MKAKKEKEKQKAEREAGMSVEDKRYQDIVKASRKLGTYVTQLLKLKCKMKITTTSRPLAKIVKARYEAFGCAGQASKIRVIGLEAMASRYSAGELEPRVS